MKNAVIAVLVVFGISVSSSVFACEGSNHKAKSGTSTPATSTPATTTK